MDKYDNELKNITDCCVEELRKIIIQNVKDKNDGYITEVIKIVNQHLENSKELNKFYNIGEINVGNNIETNIIGEIQNETLESFKKLQKESLELFEKKNTDYGNAYSKHGVIGLLVRIGDKISRMQNITKTGITLVKDEKLRDTLIDLHNYSALAILLIDSGI